MLSLLSMVIGFLCGIIPSIIRYYEREQHFKINGSHNNTTQEIITNNHWTTYLSKSVRPIISYIFAMELVLLTLLFAFDVISKEQYHIIWVDGIGNLFSAIVCFWFGDRSLTKR